MRCIALCKICKNPFSYLSSNRPGIYCSIPCRRQGLALDALEKRAAKFAALVDRSGGPDQCWPWQGRLDPHGYGVIGASRKTTGVIYAHRYAWEQAYGILPEGIHVLHHCDNPLCCNARKCLFAGTTRENVEDRHAKGRDARRERQWKYKFTDAQIAAVYALKGTASQRIIGEQFGMHQTVVSEIWAKNYRF